MCKTKHAFLFESHFKPLHQSKSCGDPVDNRSYEPICVLGDKDRENNINLRHDLKHFGVLCTVGYFYKVTPY